MRLHRAMGEPEFRAKLRKSPASTILEATGLSVGDLGVKPLDPAQREARRAAWRQRKAAKTR